MAAGGDAVRFTEIGSGVLISADGRIMTAARVVHTMDEISVELASGETVPARVVASEPAADLSLIKLDRVPPGAKPAPMANSESVRIGDQVIVVGAPYGLAHSMTVGWISARWGPNTIYKEMPLAEFFQTDAVINQGNSGGPMFSMAGEVIGIVSHNISKSGGSEGLGKLLLDQRSVWSGLEGRQALGLRGGGKVATIGGEKIVVGGDVILKMQGIPVNDFASYERIRAALMGLSSGASVTVTILRAGEVIDLQGRFP